MTTDKQFQGSCQVDAHSGTADAEVSFSFQPVLDDELWCHSQDRNSVLLSSCSVTAYEASATIFQAADGFAETAHLSDTALLFKILCGQGELPLRAVWPDSGGWMDWHCELEHGKEICLRESRMNVYLPGMGV